MFLLEKLLSGLQPLEGFDSALFQGGEQIVVKNGGLWFELINGQMVKNRKGLSIWRQDRRTSRSFPQGRNTAG